MKMQKQITVKLASLFMTGMIMVALISTSACTNKSTSSMNTTESKKKVKAPSVDVHAAAFMGNIKAMDQHIAIGSDLNAKDQYGSTPLHIACTFGKTEIAIALINGGANLNETSKDGSTALHTAAFFCRTKIVEALLEKGADKTVKNLYGSTALQSVQAPFESTVAIYKQIGKDLGPFGLKLDYEQLEKTRPVIASLLQD